MFTNYCTVYENISTCSAERDITMWLTTLMWVCNSNCDGMLSQRTFHYIIYTYIHPITHFTDTNDTTLKNKSGHTDVWSVWSATAYSQLITVVMLCPGVVFIWEHWEQKLNMLNFFLARPDGHRYSRTSSWLLYRAPRIIRPCGTI